MLLSASRRTQPLEMLECVVVGCGAEGQGVVRRSLGSRGQEVGDKSLGAQGSQAPGCCFQGGGVKEEEEAGHEVSGQNPGATQSQAPREALGDHSRDTHTLPHPCPLPWPPPWAGVSCEIWAGWRRSLMLLARYLGR